MILIEQETYRRHAEPAGQSSASTWWASRLTTTACAWTRCGAEARGAEEKRRDAQVHLHHPDRAEPDRLDHAGERGVRRCWRSRANTTIPIFEDECYSDLDLERQAAEVALCDERERQGVIFVGSFSKSIAPALRVGYIVAAWDVMARMLALKTDAGSGALEQMVLAEFCTKHFANHVPKLTKACAQAAGAARGAGRAVRHRRRIRRSAGRHLPLDQAARRRRHAEAGSGRARGRRGAQSRPANGRPTRPTPGPAATVLREPRARDDVKKGVEVLAEVCRREFGVPLRSANVERRELE